LTITVFFNSPGGKLYAGEASGNICSGKRVINGKLWGNTRNPVYGDIIAHVEGDPITAAADGAIPRHIAIMRECGLRVSIGQFLDSMED
jgi:hypothetical protein